MQNISWFRSTRRRVSATIVALLCVIGLLLTVGSATAQPADEYPAPRLFIEPIPVVPGESLTLTTNAYAGPRDGDGPKRIETIEQCPPVSSRSASNCIRVQTIDTHRYLTRITVTPHRAMQIGKRLIDCAAEANSCYLRLLENDDTATPISFVEQDSPLPKESIEMATPDNLESGEPVSLVVKTPLSTPIRILQCVKVAPVGRTCTAIANKYLQGDPSGKVATRETTIRPQRILANKNKTVDCGKPNRRRPCYLVVESRESGRHQIGARLPITFDPNESVKAPRLVAPDGPFADDEQVGIEVHSLVPGTRIIVQCNQGKAREACGAPVRSLAGGDGTATAVITLSKLSLCVEGERTKCELMVRTHPRTMTLRKQVLFE